MLKQTVEQIVKVVQKLEVVESYDDIEVYKDKDGSIWQIGFEGTEVIFLSVEYTDANGDLVEEELYRDDEVGM